MTKTQTRSHITPFLCATIAVLCFLLTGSSNVARAQGEWSTSGTNISNTNSGNVGIGTSSPNAKLVIASGNMGLGTNTISTWTAQTSVIESLNTSIFFGQITDLHFNSNVYHNNGWKYKTTGTAANYYLHGGTHYWRVAGSGSVGQTVNWNEAMTLTNGGNLGLGTTTPTSLQGGYSSLAGTVFQVRNSNSGVAQINISASGSGNVAALGFEVGDATSTKRLFQQSMTGPTTCSSSAR